MRRSILTLLLCHILYSSIAGTIIGKVTDDKGNPLPYASILVKGSTIGTTANKEGDYVLNLNAGTYTIYCQYIGYKREEQSITLDNNKHILNFQLQVQELTMEEVIVKKGEDPAYEIIRQAIKKRNYYQDQLKEFQCEVYTKGQLQLRDHPNKLFGQKVDFEDGDTSKKKILYLSETVATYSVQKPNKAKVEVTSSKVSGQTDGFGLSAPQVFSFYDNIVNIGNLNPRGFVSPIASNALNFYKYKFEGSYYQDGKEINHIKVIPKRKYEPLFSGYIDIAENEWRIHSVQLMLTKESQIEFLDTLKIDQIYVPLTNDVWVIKNQVIYPTFKFLGFSGFGSFVNVYSKFDIDPQFTKKDFGNTILKYADSSNKKSSAYWDTIRPIPLQADEIKDYKKKDSLELVRKDPHYLDSIDKKRNKLTPLGLIVTGQTFVKQKSRSSISFVPLLQAVNFNTVEGLVVDLQTTYTKRIDSNTNSRRSFYIRPDIRYGFSNHHFNAYLSGGYNYGKKYLHGFSFSGGKRVFQFNNANPIDARDNTFASLQWERNYMKIYEAWFGRINYFANLGEGLTLNIGMNYQDRMPLENTTDYKWRNRNNISYTPNFPEEKITQNIPRHQAFSTTVGINWQPGNKYIELPGRKISVGSKYPNLNLSYTKGIRNIFGSDVSYDKWKFSISDNLNLKLKGAFSYRLSVGGFIRVDSIYLPDYTHFNGNRLTIAAPYLNSFQLAPYYKYSNTEKFYTTLHAEHHFNGFLTNKIPVFKKLNWNLVAGTNAFFVSKDNNYVEAFVGLENILKVLRVDFVWGFEPDRRPHTGIRLGFKGVLGGRNDD